MLLDPRGYPDNVGVHEMFQRLLIHAGLDKDAEFHRQWLEANRNAIEAGGGVSEDDSSMRHRRVVPASDQDRTLTRAQWKRYQRRFDAIVVMFQDLVEMIRSSDPKAAAVVPRAGLEAVVASLELLMDDIRDATVEKSR